MAVTVERIPQLVLDADYRIVEIGPAAEGAVGDLRGRSLWDVWPDARPLFEPYYERTWLSRQPVAFVQYFHGTVARIEAAVRADRLEISWEVLHRIDTLTLDGLAASLDEAVAILEGQEGQMGGDRARPSLYAEGGSTRS